MRNFSNLFSRTFLSGSSSSGLFSSGPFLASFTLSTLSLACLFLLNFAVAGVQAKDSDDADDEAVIVAAMANPPDMMISTTENLDGFKIKQYKGIVRGVSVRQPTVGQGLSANLERMGGGKISAYVAMCEKGRQQAFNTCVARARAMGANAIVGVRYDSTAFNHGDNVVTEAVCYGTAVVLEKP